MNDCARDLQNYIIVNKTTNYIIINNTILAESAILITNISSILNVTYSSNILKWHNLKMKQLTNFKAFTEPFSIFTCVCAKFDTLTGQILLVSEKVNC